MNPQQPRRESLRRETGFVTVPAGHYRAHSHRLISSACAERGRPRFEAPQSIKCGRATGLLEGLAARGQELAADDPGALTAAAVTDLGSAGRQDISVLPGAETDDGADRQRPLTQDADSALALVQDKRFLKPLGSLRPGQSDPHAAAWQPGRGPLLGMVVRTNFSKCLDQLFRKIGQIGRITIEQLLQASQGLLRNRPCFLQKELPEVIPSFPVHFASPVTRLVNPLLTANNTLTPGSKKRHADR